MDISEFAASLLPQSESLLREWFPAGKRAGDEYKLGSLNGEPGESLSINIKTGLWADFAGEHRGGDLVSLYAAARSIGQYEAAKQLGYKNGMALAAPTPALEATPDPPPADAPPIPKSSHGTPVDVYDYRDAAGALLFKIARYEPADGRKLFTPYTWRGGKWSAKAWPKPRPLYGLESLWPGKRVLVVEGEKACHAARRIVGGRMSVLTWAGGAAAVKTADWSPLYGKNVDLWPDADEAGSKAVATIAEILLPHLTDGATLRILAQTGQPDGWDLADAEADGWDMDRMAAHVKRDDQAHIRVVTAPQPATAPQRGKPHDGKGAIEVAPEPGQPRSAAMWHQDLQLDGNGNKPYETEANLMRIMTGHDAFAGKFWLDEFSQMLMFGNAPLERVDAINVMIFLQQNLAFHKISLQSIERAALAVGNLHKRHPVREWLTGLRWDGQPRLATLMADAFGTPQDAYTAAVGRCWLVSMVARIFEPGCQADYMPVFEGSQGVFKSTAMRILGGQWFMESHCDPIHDRKEFLQGLQGHWLIEIPEMHTISGRGNGIEKIKGIITNRVDEYREPYGVRVRPYPRQCVFAGTTNHDQWNPDATGGRRFWPIACGQIERGYLRDMREQLFAEAVSEYKRTGDWYSVPTDMAQAEQEARRERDAWEDVFMQWIGSRQEVTVTEVLQDCLHIEVGHWKQNDQNRVARVLRSNGWKKMQVRHGGARTWAYRRSHTLAQSLGLDSTDTDEF